MTRARDRAVAVWAGLSGGAAMLGWLVLVAPLASIPPMGVLRVIAAVVLGRNVLPPPSLGDGGVATVALFIHFFFSIAYALVLESILRRYGRRGSMFAGVAFGLCLYILDSHWLAPFRGWIGVLAHVIWGFATAATYEGLRAYRQRPGYTSTWGVDKPHIQ